MILQRGGRLLCVRPTGVPSLAPNTVPIPLGLIDRSLNAEPGASSEHLQLWPRQNVTRFFIVKIHLFEMFILISIDDFIFFDKVILCALFAANSMFNTHTIGLER